MQQVIKLGSVCIIHFWQPQSMVVSGSGGCDPIKTGFPPMTKLALAAAAASACPMCVPAAGRHARWWRLGWAKAEAGFGLKASVAIARDWFSFPRSWWFRSLEAKSSTELVLATALAYPTILSVERRCELDEQTENRCTHRELRGSNLL